MASDKDVIDTIIAEAGNNPEGMTAVAFAILNRSEKSGKTPVFEVKRPSQFEGYENPGSGSRAAQKDPKVRAAAERVWADVQARKVPDPLNGGTMFHADSAKPYWSKAENKFGTANIGGQTFYLGSAKPNAAVAAIDAVAPTVPDRRPDSVSAYSPQPAPRETSLLPATKVKTVPVNPTNGSPVNFPALRSAALQRDIGAVGRTPVIPAAKTSVASMFDTAAKPAVMPQGKTTAQIGQEADNARLSGYRQIQEMGPSSKGAVPAVPAARAPSAKQAPSPKSGSGVKTTTSFTPSAYSDGLSIAALFGSGPTPDGYVAQARPAAQREPETFRVGTGPNSNRLTPNAAGYNDNTVNPVTGAFPFNYPPNAAVDAINANTGLQASLLSKGIAGHNRYMSSISDMFGSGGANPGDTGMFGIPMSDGMAQILATDPKYRAPAGSAPTRWKAAPAAAPAPTGNLLTTLADMFSGVSAPQPTYTTTPFQQENFQTTAGAQMPSSMNNSRWTTGY